MTATETSGDPRHETDATSVTALLREDQAVSPVIGVILMVAITVILAAVVGTFLLGIGQSQQTTPQATFEFENYDDDSDGDPDALNVSHTGGDTFPADTLEFRAKGDSVVWDSEVSAGDKFVVSDDGGTSTGAENGKFSSGVGDYSDLTISFVYVSPDGENTVLLREWDADA